MQVLGDHSRRIPENFENLDQIFHEEALAVVFDNFAKSVDVPIVEHRGMRIREQFDSFVHVDWLHLDAW